jgi:hypothetical protein
LNETEIKEATEIGKLVRRGAASKTDKFASSLNEVSISAQIDTDNECGCNK